MKIVRFASLVLLALSLSSGCASDLDRPEYNVQRPARPALPPEPQPVAPPPLTVVAPADRWHDGLARVAPAGWTVGDAEDQIESPWGWNKVSGDRGLRFELREASGSARVLLTLMPEGFEARSLELGLVLTPDGKLGRGIAMRPAAGSDRVEAELPFGPTEDGYVLFTRDSSAGKWAAAVETCAQVLKAKRAPKG